MRSFATFVALAVALASPVVDGAIIQNANQLNPLGYDYVVVGM
jgi:hypothetical protein